MTRKHNNSISIPCLLALAFTCTLAAAPAHAVETDVVYEDTYQYSKGGAIAMSIIPTVVGVGAGIWVGIDRQDIWASAGISMGSLALLPSTGYIYIRSLNSKSHLSGLLLRTALSGSTLLLWWGVTQTNGGAPAETMAAVSLFTLVGALYATAVSIYDIGEQTDIANRTPKKVSWSAGPNIAKTPITNRNYITLEVTGTF